MVSGLHIVLSQRGRLVVQRELYSPGTPFARGWSGLDLSAIFLVF